MMSMLQYCYEVNCLERHTNGGAPQKTLYHLQVYLFNFTKGKFNFEKMKINFAKTFQSLNSQLLFQILEFHFCEIEIHMYEIDL